MTSPAKNRERALALLARGFTRDDVARKVGVSERTVYRWQRAASAVESAPSAVEPASADDRKPEDLAPSSAPPAGDDADDILSIARGIIAEQKAIAQLAKQDGNTNAAARALKSAGDAANLVGRLEQRRKASADVVTFTRAELDAANKRVHEIFDGLRADLERTGGLVCSSCGRAIRVYLASDGTDSRGKAP